MAIAPDAIAMIVMPITAPASHMACGGVDGPGPPDDVR